jgi:FSR family fosmidomycin resistance protein-like MFS transporter
MRLVRDTFFLTIAATHFVVDLLGSQIALLMAFFAQTLGLSNTDIGIVVGGYSLTSAVSQPIFGWLTDRIGARWIASGGLFWTAGFISVALFLQNKASLPFLIIAGLGTGAFHPAGTMEATRRGYEYYAGHATTAASLFFVFGQIGYSVGPAIGGLLLGHFSAPGLMILTLLAIPTGLNVVMRLRPIPQMNQDEIEELTSLQEMPRELRTGWIALAAFTILIALRSWAYSGMAAFLPKYLLDGGIDLGQVGLFTALYMGGSALGNVVGGILSDNWGKRVVVLGTHFLVSIPLYAFAQSGISNWMYLLLPLSGFLIGGSHSALVVITQSLMPHRMATASGLILGFMFSAESIGVYFNGLMADSFGLQRVFQIIPLLTIIAAVLALTLKTKSQNTSSRVTSGFKS